MKTKRWLVGMIAVSGLALSGVFIFAQHTKDEFSPEVLAELAAVKPGQTFKIAKDRFSPDLAPPVRLEADDAPIDIGKLSNIAHAGPWIADVDGDSDRDLLVGDFPGYFWLFENVGTEAKPVYSGKGRLKAGGEDAKTPVY